MNNKKIILLESNRKKTVLIYPPTQKRHTIFTPTISFLSNEYNVIYEPIILKSSKIIPGFSKFLFVRYLYFKYLRPIISLNEISQVFNHKKELDIDIDNVDLIFSSNIIPKLNKNFIVDIEIVTALAGYDYGRLNKKKIENELASNKCKAIICWYDISKESLLKVLDCTKFIDKIKVIPFAIKYEKIIKDYGKKEINLLFVSSVNNPRDFEQKGGIIALEVYKKLLENNKNIKFTIRSWIPEWIKKKYGNLEGINFIEDFISDEELKKIFIKTDILLEPVPGLNLLLECMKYKIPAVSYDFRMISEIIKDKKTGFVVDSSSIFGEKQDMNSYLKNLNLNYFKLYKKRVDEKILKDYLEKMNLLLKNKNLIKKMGEKSNFLIKKNGLYNLEKRNKAIKKIFKDSFHS